jgi:hypothetical protein
MENRTTVNVSEDTWKRLTMRRGPGDTYDDVITELLDIAEEQEDAGD